MAPFIVSHRINVQIQLDDRLFDKFFLQNTRKTVAVFCIFTTGGLKVWFLFIFYYITMDVVDISSKQSQTIAKWLDNWLCCLLCSPLSDSRSKNISWQYCFANSFSFLSWDRMISLLEKKWWIFIIMDMCNSGVRILFLFYFSLVKFFFFLTCFYIERFEIREKKVEYVQTTFYICTSFW